MEEKYSTFIYKRLSKEDERLGESMSIENQHKLLTSFVETRSDLKLVGDFSDDGYSGYDFNRPDFQEMMKRIKNGEANCIVVKDFSRLGRNFLKVEEYLQIVFPQQNIRFISVADDYDSIRECDFNDLVTTPIKNLANEFFVAATSKSVRRVQEIKRRNGELINNFAVYGYVKVDKQFVVDDEAADIVRRIFNLKLEGMSNAGIGDLLNKNDIPCPMEYKLANKIPVSDKLKKNEKAAWSAVSVKRILENPAYTGTLIQGKTTTRSYKDKHRFVKNKSEWAVFENSHDPIISEDVFQIIQELLSKDGYSAGIEKQSYLFSGYTFCGSCGEVLYRRAEKKAVYYVCKNKNCKSKCNIKEISLESAVRNTLKAHINIVTDLNLHPEKVQHDINEFSSENEKTLLERKKNIESMRAFLISERENGKMCEVEFVEMNELYNRKIAAINAEKENLKNARERLSKQIDKVFANFIEYTQFTELTRKIIVLFIQKIIIESKTSIKIFWRYSDMFSDVANTELIDTLNKVGDDFAS